MMNAQATNKPTEKSNPKPNTTKPGADQEKVINQLRQEIRTLSKAVKEMQQRTDTQAVVVTMPQELFSKFNAYLSDCNRNAGTTVSLSALICEAMDLYLWAEEENKQKEEEREKAELEKRGKG
jgi:hypothetical protein